VEPGGGGEAKNGRKPMKDDQEREAGERESNQKGKQRILAGERRDGGTA